MSAPSAEALGARRAFAQQLLASGLLLDTGVRGVFGRGPVFEDLVRRLERRADASVSDDGAVRVGFPPVTPRATLVRTGFLSSLPQLCGSVHGFDGDEGRQAELVERAATGRDWSPCLHQTECVLTPAACYPLYPTLPATLPAEGRLYDMTGYCFRREPSDDPARMQAFRMREQVRLGTPEQVKAWRAGWLERGLAWVRSLGLPAELTLANDPFFGRGGRLMQASQRELELKFEIAVPLYGKSDPTAVASFNYHQQHFTSAFGVSMPGGAEAHSACLGFGLERLVLALLRFHGLDPADWPGAVRHELGW